MKAGSRDPALYLRRVYAAVGRRGDAIRCGAAAARIGFAFAKGVRFSASSRRSRDLVPPVNRASSGSFLSEKTLAFRSVGAGLGNCSRCVTGVTEAPDFVRRPGKEAWIRAILLGIVAICILLVSMIRSTVTGVR